jgi:nicotinamide-nucleotide amidase
MKELEQAAGRLITIGDELLLGDIPDGNAHHIALELRSGGFRLNGMVTVGDDEEAIAKAFQDVSSSGDRFVIVTGGLGPTADDRTTDAAAKAFGLPLVQNAEYEQWLRDWVDGRGCAWSERTARMARLPEGAAKLTGEEPMAGFMMERQGVPWYFLPGVPHEMRELLASHVIPDLKRRFPSSVVYLKRILRVQGVAESLIGSRLEELERKVPDVRISYLPQPNENWVGIFVAANSREEAENRAAEIEKEVVALLGYGCVSGRDDENLETTVGGRLRRKGWKLVVAESCTGGLLARRITSVAGASDYFDRGFITYSNGAKMDLLGVEGEVLLAHGAVSFPVAEAMARGARTRSRADAALAITGIAGPSGGTPEKPVGTVFIACATSEGVTVEKHLFAGPRERIQESSAHAALALLWRTLH